MIAVVIFIAGLAGVYASLYPSAMRLLSLYEEIANKRERRKQPAQLHPLVGAGTVVALRR